MQLRKNTTRLCEHIVSQQCLQVRLPEDCIAEVLAGSSSTRGSNSSSQGAGSGGAIVVPIAVPVAIGGEFSHVFRAELCLAVHVDSP